MNWYKRSQQNLLFYPYEEHPSLSSIKVNPISVDPETGENVYRCYHCGKSVLESNTKWHRALKGETYDVQSPQYSEERISQGLNEIAQYLLPFLQKLYEYIKTEELEKRKNDTYDYGYTTGLYRWEDND